MQAAFEINPASPFDFDLMANFITYYRGKYAADSFENGVFRRLRDLGNGKLALASVTSLGTVDAPVLQVELQGDDLDEDAIIEARRQVMIEFGVDDDLSPFYKMASQDRHLAPMIDSLRGLRVSQSCSVFEALILAILGQQISTHVARMLRVLLTETYGESMEVNGERFHIFPQAKTIADASIDALRDIKFSQRKAEYVFDIASSVASRELDLEGLRSKTADDAVKTLVAIRGVGDWTAHWLLIRALGQPDGFPYGDLALQRGMGLLVGDGTPMSQKDALDYSERWAPYRSYVTTYLFGAMRSKRLEGIVERIQPA